jgi:hypothetical protein
MAIYQSIYSACSVIIILELYRVCLFLTRWLIADQWNTIDIVGGKEFFRVVPKDNPPAQTFNVEGVQVNVSKLR